MSPVRSVAAALAGGLLALAVPAGPVLADGLSPSPSPSVSASAGGSTAPSPSASTPGGDSSSPSPSASRSGSPAPSPSTSTSPGPSTTESASFAPNPVAAGGQTTLTITVHRRTALVDARVGVFFDPSVLSWVRTQAPYSCRPLVTHEGMVCDLPTGATDATYRLTFDAPDSAREYTVHLDVEDDNRYLAETTATLRVLGATASPSRAVPSGTPGTGLPVTGTSLGLVGGLAAVLLGAGGALVLAARRRRA
ncbi:MAG TPA: hypothetical protein VGN37_05220 [Actinocatenispora sp.]